MLRFNTDSKKKQKKKVNVYQTTGTDLLAPRRGIHVVVRLRWIHFRQQETCLQQYTSSNKVINVHTTRARKT